MKLGPTSVEGRNGPWLAVLVALLAALAIRAALLDRSSWPGFIGDEATYLMAAESIAWDGDFLYERGDYDRFVEHWGRRPEMLLFLQSNDHGRTLVYAKPFFFPLLAAPLTRLSPTHGPLLTNVLLLALAAVLTARALRPQLGAEAPLWVAAFLFGSVAFAYGTWAHADSFLMSATAIALALGVIDRRADRKRSRRRPGTRQLVLWFGIGVLFAVVAFSRPFYATLALPLIVLLPKGKRVRLGAAFAVGVILVVSVSATVHWRLAGAVTSYTGERGGFYAREGLPEVDFPGESWDDAIFRTGNFSWYQARQPLEQKTRVGLWTWNVVYFLVGEHVGLVPYFLPFVLALFCFRLDALRLALLGAMIASLAAFFFYRPFNFFGGGAAIGNRYFLALYPAVWFLVARPPLPAVRRWAPLAVVLAATPFLSPLWMGLEKYPLTNEQTYQFVSPVARFLLPFETTQSHLKPGGQEDVIHNGVWVRVLSPATRADRDRIWVRSGDWAELLVAFRDPIERLELIGPAGAAVAEVSTGEITGRRFGDGVVTYELRMPPRRARHSMWWSWEPWNLYRLRVRFTGSPTGEVVGFYLEVPGTR